MPIRRIFSKKYRSRGVNWAIVYTFYLFVALGLIVASAITLKFGDDFFPNLNADNAGGSNGSTGATGATTQTGEDEGEDATGVDPVTGLPTVAVRRTALIEAGVISSIGIASGVVALVLNLASFVVQTWLNSRWDRAVAKESVYPAKLYTGLLIFSVNMILFGGNIALSWGFARVSTHVKTAIRGTQAATASYLVAASVLAGMTAFMALATAISDFFSLKEAEKENDERYAENEGTGSAVGHNSIDEIHREKAA